MAKQTQPAAVNDGYSSAIADNAEFRDRFGEELRAVLDVGSWKTGFDPFREYERVAHEVREAVDCETEYQRRVRTEIFPLLFDASEAVKGCGVYDANDDILRMIHRGLLFNGGVEGCDATLQRHETLPLTIYQIGVSLVSYRGDQGTWHQRLFRRDLRQKLDDSIEGLHLLLQRRSTNQNDRSDELGELARNTIVQYAERAILLRRSDAVWRMGRGNPVTYELLTGGGYFDLMLASTQMLRDMFENHQRFLYVAGEPRERLLHTIGQALEVDDRKQYAIVCTLADIVRRWFHQLRFKSGVTRELYWDDEPIEPTEWIPRFLERVASQVVVGVYRASPIAPAHLFYAHVDWAHFAAHIAIADSMLQIERGFPLLLDLADHVCTSVFGGSLDYLTETAYNEAGAPYRFQSERNLRGN